MQLIKNLLTLLLICLLLCPGVSYGVELGGKYSLLFEDLKNADGQRESVVVNYLYFDADRLLTDPVSLHGYGKYSYEIRDGFSSLSMYYLYGQYRAFEGKTELKVGRFPIETHRFLTLDGAFITLRADSPVGVSLYAGVPRYMELYTEHSAKQFRITGDYLAGAKVFLRGVEGFRANASYSREGKGTSVYRELFGIAGGKDFLYKIKDYDATVSLDGSIDYNPSESAIDKLTARLFVSYSPQLRFIVQADRYDVKDEYPADRELIISLLSSGREDRVFYTASYDISKSISLYQGTVFTRLKMPDGAWRNGVIVKGGVTGNFIKEAGLDFNAGLYHFKSFTARATGIAANVKYRPFKDWDMSVGAEIVSIDAPFREDKIAKTFTAEIGYMPKSKFRFALFAEQSDNPEYKSDFRSGFRLDYFFSISSQGKAGEGSI